jgi:CheY-like chemotaxis protein
MSHLSPAILVIDDEPVVLQGVARICGSEGLPVTAAASGRAGLERLQTKTYQLILCDIMMEEMNGFEFLAEAARRKIRTPIIMMTGYSTGENAIRSLQAGAIDYLPKPFTAEELMAVVRRGLNSGELPATPSDAPGSANGHVHPLGTMSWAHVRPEGTVVIGLSEHFVRSLHGVQAVELSAVGTNLVQGTRCATIRSAAGLAHAAFCPVSGQVIAVHAELAASPSMLEQDPHGAGWLYRILPADFGYSMRCLTSPSAAPQPCPEPQAGESS